MMFENFYSSARGTVYGDLTFEYEEEIVVRLNNCRRAIFEKNFRLVKI